MQWQVIAQMDAAADESAALQRANEEESAKMVARAVSRRVPAAAASDADMSCAPAPPKRTPEEEERMAKMAARSLARRQGVQAVAAADAAPAAGGDAPAAAAVPAAALESSPSVEARVQEALAAKMAPVEFAEVCMA